MSVKKSAFQKLPDGNYHKDVKKICLDMYTGTYMPEGQNFTGNLNAICDYTGILKYTLNNWKARDDWKEKLEEANRAREIDVHDDVYRQLQSIKKNNLAAIENYVKNNKTLGDEDDLKKRVDTMKTIVSIEDKLLSEEEREKHQPTRLLTEIKEFEKEFWRKDN